MIKCFETKWAGTMHHKLTIYHLVTSTVSLQNGVLDFTLIIWSNYFNGEFINLNSIGQIFTCRESFRTSFNFLEHQSARKHPQTNLSTRSRTRQ